MPASRSQPSTTGLPARRTVLTGVALGAATLTGCTSGSNGPRQTGSAAVTASSGSPASASSTTAHVPRVDVLLTGLDVPWDVRFLPDRTALLTLRDKAQVLAVSADGRTTSVLGTVPGVDPGGEGGLLGVAPSPAYAEDHVVFLYCTAAGDNRVVRARIEDGRLSGFDVVLSGIAKSSFHNGGRIAFGPDGHLYVGTGDAGDRARSQDRDSLNGKILRITRDGAAAPGNPFGNRVWTYGHRNVQGLAWSTDGQMYASEFGQDTWDELNRIVKGRDYGWPAVEGFGDDPRYADPLAVWPTDQASPSGIAVGPDGAVWMAALRGEALWRVEVNGTDERSPEPERFLHKTYGRLRDVTAAPDGSLWVLTSNTFRGTPGPDDDRLLRVTLP